MENDIQKRVIQAIAEVMERDPGTISPDASLQQDLGCDSLKQMTIFILLEDEFQRTMPPEELTGINTVRDIADFIQKKLRESVPT